MAAQGTPIALVDDTPGQHEEIYEGLVSSNRPLPIDLANINEDNPLHIKGGKLQDYESSVQTELLGRLLIEFKILNAYNAVAHDVVITESDIEV